jgi:hypothetical protein
MESLQMGTREQLEVGNNLVEAETQDEFADGYTNGSLYYYDTNRQLVRPLTTKSIYQFMTENLFDKQATAQWNAGFVFGWIAALCENNPAFFFASVRIPESNSLPVVALQEV